MLSPLQCKHWRDTIGVKIVRELQGVVATEKATKGVVIGTSRFTKDAKEFARKSGVELLDGVGLVKMINRIKTGQRLGVVKDIDSGARPAAAKVIDSQFSRNPVCDCGRVMVKRVAKSGKNRGNAFWGCSAYPDCRNTQEIRN